MGVARDENPKARLVGRLFGALLILMGIALFTMLTASFTVFFMAGNDSKIRNMKATHIKTLSVFEKRLLLFEAKFNTLLGEKQKQAVQKIPKDYSAFHTIAMGRRLTKLIITLGFIRHSSPQHFPA
jgi:hypothetical protein